MLPNICGDFSIDYFINKNQKNSIQTLLPSAEIKIIFKTAPIQISKLCFICVERIESLNLLQIRISEAGDLTKLWISTVDGKKFEQLKEDQSLHVTFCGFLDNFNKILNSCLRDELQINLIEERNSFVLQFVEVRSFRNLVHLLLPVEQAPSHIILHYMSKSIEQFQKRNNSYDTTIQSLQFELNRKNEIIANLNKDMSTLNTKLNDQQRNAQVRNNEEINRFQANIRQLSEAKRNDENRFKEKIANLEHEFELLKRENLKITEEKMKEIKKTESLQEENNRYKSNLANLKEQNERLNCEISSFRNQDKKHEMSTLELRKIIHDLQDNLKKLDKSKSEIAAQLEAEKKICNLKRNALQIATDEIAKANDIISKQSKDIAKMKDTIECRTEIAIKQELAMQEKERELLKEKDFNQRLENEIRNSRDQTQNLFKQINTLNILVDKMENGYALKIKELTKKIDNLDKENHNPRYSKIK